VIIQKPLIRLLVIIETYEDDFASMGITMKYAGSGYKGLIFTDLILEGQIMSLILSIIIVVILLSFMFRNIKAGLIGAVPILITALISFWCNGVSGYSP